MQQEGVQLVPGPGGLPQDIPKAVTAAQSGNGETQATQPSGRRSKFSSVPPPGVQAQQAPPPAAGHIADPLQQPAHAMQFVSAGAPQQYGFEAQQPQQQGLASSAVHGAAAHQAQAQQQPPVQSLASIEGAPDGYSAPMDSEQQLQPAHIQRQPHMQAQPAQAQQPPPFAGAPEDGALALRITKLAEFVTRNGAEFEQQVRAKQGDNPEYAFLNNGEGSDFYRWCLFCMPRQLPLEQPLPDSWTDPLQHAAPTAEASALPPMPAEVSNGFAQVLQLLHGTQVRSRCHGLQLGNLFSCRATATIMKSYFHPC
jgi:Surp module